MANCAHRHTHTKSREKSKHHMKYLENDSVFNILTRKSGTRRMRGPDKHGMTAVHETPSVCSDSQSIEL